MPEDVESAEGVGSSNEYSASKHSKFRFKSKRSRSDNGDEHDTHRKRRKHDRHERSEEDHLHSRHHRHHHRSKRRKPSPQPPLKDDPSLYDDTYLPNPRSSQYLDPTAAFRESLFDALADDEGAAYWEGVYGQPIHTYPNAKLSPATGELERMDDEEYAAYVRARMYERTHQHVVEERERREEARRRQKGWREETARMERERGEFERRVEESLRRGEERKARKRWREAWERYESGWEELKRRSGQMDEESGGKGDKLVRDVIPWPVETGRWKHVSKEDVENFFRTAPPDEMDLHALLKTERVRWHPDKMQQRFGGQGVDDETMRSVTAVFQVIDWMWTESRDKKGAG